MKSPISGYFGGKDRMAAKITSIIDGESWRTYIEPFCGGASVFWALRKTIACKEYVLNDKDNRIINFWDVIRNKPDEFLRLMNDRAIVSKVLYARAQQCLQAAQGGPYGLRDVELAWALWYVIRLSFGGVLTSNMKRSATGKHRTTAGFLRKIQSLAEVAQHMQLAIIENDDALTIIKAYDFAGAMFYFDPPYVDTFQAHYDGYTQADFNALLDVCVGLQGKFILSHYDNPALAELAAHHGWHIVRHNTTCTVGNIQKPRTELIIMNFTPGKALL